MDSHSVAYLHSDQEVPLSEMNVSWALRGALVQSLVVAMNIAPLMHTSLSLPLRCETGLCGFLLLDMAKMIADDLCSEMRLPRGSCFMAPQTQANLQGCALSGILLCISKPEEFSPWRHGRTRLTELPIEQHFSYLRQQSPNSQLSARAFWRAACRVSLRRAWPKLMIQNDTKCNVVLYGLLWSCLFGVVHTNHSPLAGQESS